MSLSVTLENSSGTPIGVDATYSALKTIQQGPATVSYNKNDFTLDGFERVRMSEPRIVFEYMFGGFIPSLSTTIWESTAVASGTQTAVTNLYGVDLNTLVGTGTGYWIQNYSHIRYAPGVSTLLRFSFNFNALITGVRQRVGMFTDQGTYPSTAGDGMFLEADGATVSVVRRTFTAGGAGAEERIIQSNWNRDKMDGTGSSGITLNWAMAQHLVIEFAWLGVGTIRFGFETVVGMVWVHEISSSNVLTTPWSRTGTLPIRAEIHTTSAAATPGKLTLIAVSVIQEGDVLDNRGFRYFGSNSGATAKVGGTATGLYPVMSLRAASTNDMTKRAKIIVQTISISVLVVSTGATSLQVALLLLPTPNTGATFATTIAGSVTTVDTIATASTAVTGTAIANWIIPNVVGTYTFDLTGFNDRMNTIGYNAAGTVAIAGSSVVTLAVGTLTGTATVAATVAAAINWKELV